MKKNSKKMTRQRQITRREFVGGTLAAAGVITRAPAFLRGQNLNNKLNIAMIACGRVAPNAWNWPSVRQRRPKLWEGTLR